MLQPCMHVYHIATEFKHLKIGYYVHGFCDGLCSFGLDRVPSNTVNRRLSQHTMAHSSTDSELYTAASAVADWEKFCCTK